MSHISKITNPKSFLARLSKLKEVIKHLSQTNPKERSCDSTIPRIQDEKSKDIKLTEQQQMTKNLESLLGFSLNKFTK